MITCPICDYHYSEKRTHCPTCGASSHYEGSKNLLVYDNITLKEIVVAHGSERARQLPQSPRFFQLVN